MKQQRMLEIKNLKIMPIEHFRQEIATEKLYVKKKNEFTLRFVLAFRSKSWKFCLRTLIFFPVYTYWFYQSFLMYLV